MIKTIVIAMLISVSFIGCVQKTMHKTVVYILTVKDPSNIKTVGIRGKDQPLNWQSDHEMKMVQSGSTYKAIVTYVTGYKFTEAKFVVNNEFEFQDQENRKIVFTDKDTTIYTATFNVR